MVLKKGSREGSLKKANDLSLVPGVPVWYWVDGKVFVILFIFS